MRVVVCVAVEWGGKIGSPCKGDGRLFRDRRCRGRGRRVEEVGRDGGGRGEALASSTGVSVGR